MHCPQCGADQPGGVTICGFCGAVLAAPPGKAEARSAASSPSYGGAQASQRRGTALAALVAGLVLLLIGWIALAPGRGGSSGGDERGTEPVRRSSAAPAFGAEAAGEGNRGTVVEESTAGGGAGGTPLVERANHGRVSLESLRNLADELELRAEEGPGGGLAELVDVNVRYHALIDDGSERIDLRAGSPELLAHWMTGWLADEIGLSLPPDTVSIDDLSVASDGLSGRIVRQIGATGDVARVAFPRPLLESLARSRPVGATELDALDLSALVERPVDCGYRETIEVAATPTGVRVVEVERTGACGPGA